MQLKINEKFPVEFSEAGTYTVSYTHLDVYKRQGSKRQAGMCGSRSM